MPKPSKKLSGNEQLMLWLLNHHSDQYIQSPNEWIKHSQLSNQIHGIANAKANGDLISQALEEPLKGRPEHERKSKAKRLAAQIKADKTLQMRHWSIAYYQWYRVKEELQNQKNAEDQKFAKKQEIAEIIRELLVNDFPKDAFPKVVIPTTNTIATRWLRERVKSK